MPIFDVLKTTAGILQEAGKIEQYKQILEALKELLEMQKKIYDYESENKDLREKLKIKGELTFDRNCYWRKEDGGEKAGPFCTCCWDDLQKTIRMQPCGNPAYYECPKCKSGSVKVYPEKDPPVRMNEIDLNPSW